MEGAQAKKIYNALKVYREQGAYLRKLELLEKSKIAYDTGYEYGPEDVRLLIGRSITSGVSPEGAISSIADATKALELDPHNPYAHNVQANALFTMGEFEKSVMTCYRGARTRKQPPYFTDGINRGEAVLKDCVGKGGGQVLHNFLPIIRKQEAKLSSGYIEDNKLTRVSRIPTVEKKKRLTQLETRRHELLSRVMAFKYLGPMSDDKFFLQKLSKDPSIKSANTKGSQELEKLIKAALDTLTAHQDMLRTQRPYYSVKLAEKTESKYQTLYNETVLKKVRMTNTHTATNILLKRVEECQLSNNIRLMVSRAEQLQTFLDSKSPHTLPELDLITEKLYRIVGRGFLHQNRLSYRLSQASNRRRVLFLMGFPVSRPKSFDSVLATYPLQFEEPKNAFEKMLQKLDICENGYQRCWILYELGRLAAIMKNDALGKFYAKRCQMEAQKVESVSWWLNGCILLLSSDMQQGNMNEVYKAVDEAYKWAQKSVDVHIQAFLKKCYEMVSEIVVSDENKNIAKRERNIVNVVDPSDKSKAQFLMKRISMVPAGRRFYVLPKTRDPEMARQSVRRKACQGGLSIVPVQGPVKALPTVPRSKVAGFQNFDI